MKIILVIWFHTSEIESCVKTAKLSGFSVGTFRRRRSNSRISSIALGMSACEVALTLIQYCFSSGCNFRNVLSGKKTMLSSGFFPPPNTLLRTFATPITVNSCPSMSSSLPSGCSLGKSSSRSEENDVVIGIFSSAEHTLADLCHTDHGKQLPLNVQLFAQRLFTREKFFRSIVAAR